MSCSYLLPESGVDIKQSLLPHIIIDMHRIGGSTGSFFGGVLIQCTG